ncbi:MAG: fibronectin type III domain-containing protein [Saprospiraceae bacterium]
MPAPENVGVIVTGPTTASLNWSPVLSDPASTPVDRYLVIVFDSTANTLFATFDTVGLKLDLTGLTEGNVYGAEVSAKCENGLPSQNPGSATWKQTTVIIDDIVVMTPGIGTGMDDCNCDTLSGWSSIVNSSTEPVTFPLDFGTSGVDRIIYKVKVTQENQEPQERYIKLAFDEGCNKIWVIKDSCVNNSNTVALHPTTNSNSVQFHFQEDNSTFMALMPSHLDANYGAFEFDFSNCSACILEYVRCSGNWEGNCDGG